MTTEIDEAEIIEAEIIEPTNAIQLLVQVTPGEIIENFDTYKAAALEKVALYKDCDLSTLSLKEAKNARANLNTQAKLINDTRLQYERFYMEPFNVYKAKANELSRILKAEGDRLGELIKEAEEWRRNDARQRLEDYYKATYPALVAMVEFDKILDPKWLNKNHTDGKPEDKIDAIAKKAASDWESLKRLNLPNYDEAEVKFFDTLDLGAAVAENDRLEARKAIIAEQKRQMAEQEAEDERRRAERERLAAVVDPKTGEIPDDVPTPAYESPEQPERVALIAYVIEATCPIEVVRNAAALIDAAGYNVHIRRA
jgi:hypothetical protein